MKRDVVGLVAFDEVLRFALCRVVDVALEFHIRNSFLDDDPAHATRFRVPGNMVSAFEDSCHGTEDILTDLHFAFNEQAKPSLMARVRRADISWQSHGGQTHESRQNVILDLF